MFQLRPYQAEAKQAILSAWDEGQHRTLLVLPTGCGKTVVFASVAEDQVDKEHRVLIMAHRGELLEQTAGKLREASELDFMLEKAESTALSSRVPGDGRLCAKPCTGEGEGTRTVPVGLPPGHHRRQGTPLPLGQLPAR